MIPNSVGAQGGLDFFPHGLVTFLRGLAAFPSFAVHEICLTGGFATNFSIEANWDVEKTVSANWDIDKVISGSSPICDD